MQWRRSNHWGAESGAANTQETARLGVPCTGGFQLTVDWRRTWRALEAWQAGSCHSLTPFKPLETGERRCLQTGRGRLGAAIHCRRPKLRGPGAVAEEHNSLPTAHISSHGAHLFSRRTSLPTAHNATTPVFLRSCVLLDPDTPLFTRLPNLICPAGIFEVKNLDGARHLV